MNDMPLFEAADDETFDRYFGELEDLHDAVERLAGKVSRRTSRV